MPPRPHLAGPTAEVALRIYIMPEGEISHYELVGKTIEGQQTYFRAQGRRSVWSSDASFVEMVAELGQVVATALHELENVYGVQQTITDAPSRD